MANLIHLLPDHVANQIAAGEVVQRPASVVKELLENAIDAQATHLELIVSKAGKESIQLIDNGTGMSPADAELCFERHATSKIKTTQDIFNIRTNGFRGEAMASIAAVSQVKLLTKTEEDELGTLLKVSNNKITETTLVPAKKGTQIWVKNLFYTIPARRNFLKSDNVEFRHILDEFHRVAIAYPKVFFKLYHNNHLMLNLPAGNLAQRIKQIFGKKAKGALVQVEEQTDLVQIYGFIGKPEMAKKRRGEQFFFVNHRFIKSPYLHKALLDAFEHLLPNGYHPSYFINLEIDPSKIDINIHPSKTEIKFEDDFVIFSMLRAAIKHALGQYNVAPSLDFNQIPDLAFLPAPVGQVSEPQINVDPDYNPFDSSERAMIYKQKKPINDHYYQVADGQSLEIEELNAPLLNLSTEPTWKALQWNKKYLVVERKNELLFIDQHRAHQTVLFHRLKQNQKRNSLSQQLAIPIVIPIGLVEKEMLHQIEKQLINLGFDYQIKEEFLEVNAAPIEIKTEQIPKIFNDIFASINFEDELEVENLILRNLAKSSAIVSGKRLEEEEMNQLLNDLFALKNFNHSPFGKTIFTNLPIEVINKKIK